VVDLQDNLAAQRTQLAWWRTGLAALAVALGIGRLVPALLDPTHVWPFTVVGVGFGVYALLLFGYGTVQARSVRTSLEHGVDAPSREIVLFGLTAIGVVLIVATTALILTS
jgi:uncharacterized membrane protein YidH (DUF202 family)